MLFIILSNNKSVIAGPAFCIRSHVPPVADDENAEVELEDGGEEGKGHGPRPDGEEVPQHLGDHGLVGHGQLVVAGVPENLLVGGNHPG